MKISTRITKEKHATRMADRAVGRAEDARAILANAQDFSEMERLRAARRKNGVGRPPHIGRKS